jgi:hypothetical protein
MQQPNHWEAAAWCINWAAACPSHAAYHASANSGPDFISRRVHSPPLTRPLTSLAVTDLARELMHQSQGINAPEPSPILPGTRSCTDPGIKTAGGYRRADIQCVYSYQLARSWIPAWDSILDLALIQELRPPANIGGRIFNTMDSDQSINNC